MEFPELLYLHTKTSCKSFNVQTCLILNNNKEGWDGGREGMEFNYNVTIKEFCHMCQIFKCADYFVQELHIFGYPKVAWHQNVGNPFGVKIVCFHQPNIQAWPHIHRSWISPNANKEVETNKGTCGSGGGRRLLFSFCICRQQAVSVSAIHGWTDSYYFCEIWFSKYSCHVNITIFLHHPLLTPPTNMVVVMMVMLLTLNIYVLLFIKNFHKAIYRETSRSLWALLGSN